MTLPGRSVIVMINGAEQNSIPQKDSCVLRFFLLGFLAKQV